MDERQALSLLAAELPHAGDDAAVVDGLVVTTDMLHERTDFPPGTTRYTAGWRAVGASLSDVAAMGGTATAALAAYAAPSFDRTELRAFVRGAREVCESVDAAYVGGDLDDHDEFTVASTAVGRTDDPVGRDGASPGEAVCVTGTFGRSGAALRLFERGAGTDAEGDREGRDSERGDDGAGDATADPVERANELFRFPPRVRAGRALAPHAGAMMDSSDGLARSLHQLAAASDVGFDVVADRVPVASAVDEVATDAADRRDLAVHFGEDFELVATVPEAALESVRAASPTPVTRIGTVTDPEAGVRMDGDPLPDRGYTHGQV
jgi:thiamine-monophosphate kinase